MQTYKRMSLPVRPDQPTVSCKEFNVKEALIKMTAARWHNERWAA